MKRLSKRLLVAAAIVGTVLPAAAQFQKTEDAIKYRQGAYQVLGVHFGRIAAMAQGKAPFDAKAAAENADIMNAVAKLPFTAFAEGSDKGAPNRVRPEVWKDSAKFKAAADKMVVEVGKLDAAAKTGSLDAIKTQVSAVGGSCKACHDDFRAEKYSSN